MEKKVTLPQAEAKPQILLIDDDPSILRALSALVEHMAVVVTANSVKTGIAAFETGTFSAVITDYHLPDGDGIKIVDFVHSKDADLPVIMITAYGNKDLVISSINHQFFGFVEKPFDPAVVEDLVQRALQKKKKEELVSKFAGLGEAFGQLVHEITNPLSFISLKIEILEDLAKQSNNDELLNAASKLSDSVHRISEIISWTKGNLRDFSKGKTEVIQMREILDSLRQACFAKAVDRQVQVIITPGSDVQVVGNKDQLLSVLVNLVNNGIDASSEYPEKWVTVDITKQDQEVEITVTDSGPGIPEALQQKLFSPLFTTKKENGTGLGLVIVKKILKAHGGDIALNKNCKNTQFVVRLPQAA